MKEDKKHKILFVTYGAGHVQMIIPLYRELSKRAELILTVLGMTTAGKALEQRGIPYMGFKDLIRPQEDSRAIDTGKRLNKGLGRGSVPLDESIAYLGLSYTDLEERLGREEAKELYNLKGRQAFLPLTVMERLFKELSPDLLVSTISPRGEKAAILTARKLVIPSICMVDYISNISIKRASEPRYGDVVTVISEGVKKMLVKAGRDERDIVVAGNTSFDALSSPELASQSARLRELKGWGDKKIILWASHKEPERHPFTGAPGDPTLPRRIEAALFEIISRHTEWSLVVRPHPNEVVDYGPLPDGVQESGREDHLETLLGAVDVVVIMSSIVGMQARYLAKPVIQISLTSFFNDAPYREAGLYTIIDSLDELEDALKDKLSTGTSSYPEGFPPCGQATENVIRIIDKILSKKK